MVTGVGVIQQIYYLKLFMSDCFNIPQVKHIPANEKGCIVFLIQELSYGC